MFTAGQFAQYSQPFIEITGLGNKWSFSLIYVNKFVTLFTKYNNIKSIFVQWKQHLHLEHVHFLL